jgi:hypothetical protein
VVIFVVRGSGNHSRMAATGGWGLLRVIQYKILSYSLEKRGLAILTSWSVSGPTVKLFATTLSTVDRGTVDRGNLTWHFTTSKVNTSLSHISHHPHCSNPTIGG